MKTIKIIGLTIAITVFFTNAGNLFAQNKYEQVKIHTSAKCGMCKTRIENALAYESGIKESLLDLESKIITVVYNPKKTSPEKIKKAISETGYDADEIKANPEAYNSLPACCKSSSGNNDAHRNCNH